MKRIFTFLLLFLLAFSVFSVVSVQAQSGGSAIPPGTYVVEDGETTINGTTYNFRQPYGILRIGVTYRMDTFSNGEYSLSGGTASIDGFNVDFSPYASDGTVYVSGGDVVISTNSSNEPYTSSPSRGDISSSGDVTINSMDLIVPGVESGTLVTYSNRFEISYSGGNFNVTYNASTDGFYARYASEGYGSSGPDCVWSCVDSSEISGTMWPWFRAEGVSSFTSKMGAERLFSGDEDIYDNESEWGGEDFGTTGDPDPDEYINGSFGAHEGIHHNNSSGPQYGKVDEDITTGSAQKPVFFSYLANDDNWENPRDLSEWNENAIASNITGSRKVSYPIESDGSGSHIETGDVNITEEDPEGRGWGHGDSSSDISPGIKGAYVDIFTISPLTRTYLNNESISCPTSSNSSDLWDSISSVVGGGGGPVSSPGGCGSALDLTEPRIRENGNDIMIKYDAAVQLPHDAPTSAATPGCGCEDCGYLSEGYYYDNANREVKWVSLSAKTKAHDPNAEADTKWGNNSSSPGYDSYYEILNTSDSGVPNASGSYQIFEDVSFNALGGEMNYTQSHWGIGQSIDGPKPVMKGAIDLKVDVKYNVSLDWTFKEWDVGCDDDSVESEPENEPWDNGTAYGEYLVSDNETYVIEEPPIVGEVRRLHDGDTTYTHIDMDPLKYSNPRRMWNSIKREKVDKSTEYYGLESNYVITGYYQFFSSRDKRWDKLETKRYNRQGYDMDDRFGSSSIRYFAYTGDYLSEDEAKEFEGGDISEGTAEHTSVPVYQFAFPGADLALNGTPKTKVGYRWMGDSGYLSGFIGTPKLEKHKVCERMGDGTGTNCHWLHLKDPRANRTVKNIKYKDPSKFTFESTETYSNHWNENDNITRTSGPNWFKQPFDYNRSLKMERLVRGNDAKIAPGSHAVFGWDEFNAGTPEFEFSILSKGNVSTGTPTVINASVHPPECNTDPYSTYCRKKESWELYNYPTHIDLNKSNYGNLVLEEVSPLDVQDYNETNTSSSLTNYSHAFRKEVEPNHKNWTYEIPANVEKVRLRYEGSNWQNMENVWASYGTVRYLSFPWVRDDFDWPQYDVRARHYTCTSLSCPGSDRVRWEDEYPWTENSQTFTVKETRFSSITDIFVTISKWTFGLIVVILIFGYLYDRTLRGGRKRR